MAKQIPLTKCKFAIVDDDDYEYLSSFKWCVNAQGYAIRGFRRNGAKIQVRMHLLVKPRGEGQEVDHINGDKLDNRKSNLRIVTRKQNSYTTKARPGTSSHKGVSWSKQKNRWRSRITVNGREIHLGLFCNEIDAAKAYNDAALKHYGEYAKLNKIE